MVQTWTLIAILRGFNEKGGGKQAKREFKRLELQEAGVQDGQV